MSTLPDEILETLNCDSCYKFLSVGPVKIYQNGTTKCGRCSQGDDDGVVSQYGLIATEIIFKCVNRFDGCRQLLSYSEVAEHEFTCHSETHVCPLCEETMNIPTFLLVKHFKDYHPNLFLQIPLFREEVTAVPRVKRYLYRVQDNLFFIEFKQTSMDSLSLNAHIVSNATQIGQAAQKFVVYFGDEPGHYETDMRTSAESSEEFSLTIPNQQVKFVFVSFHIYFGSSEIALRKVAKQKNLCFPRVVSLTVASDSRISSSPNSSSIFVRNPEQDQNELVMHCMNCSIMIEVATFVEVKPRKYHGVCYFCMEYFIRKWKNFRITLEEELLAGLENYIEYYCIWGCSRSYKIPDIHIHEWKCHCRPLFSCPVSSCFYRGKLNDFNEHFSVVHPSEAVLTFPFHHLDHSFATPCTKRLHIWAYRDFVSLEVFRQQCDWKITLLRQEISRHTSRLRAKVLINVDDNISMLSADNSSINISTQTTITVFCFFNY